MELIDYIYVPSIPDYCINARLVTAFKIHYSIWYTKMEDIHGRRSWPWWKSQLIQKYIDDYYSNNCLKAKKKVYAIEQVSEEESPTEESDSDSVGDSIREQSDKDQDPREEFLEIQDIQLEEGMPQDNENKNLCKHTQDAQAFVVTPTKGMEYIHGTATKMPVFISNDKHPFIIDSGFQPVTQSQSTSMTSKYLKSMV
ncbi:hypothetical protein O181_053006 [Austropuccinia psidii MF-1]|uniref:Uncharacterized protein n=1 Tax=Austropuccinia psidii MF-1 TaxID=1389203 RepID=A0A9Q3E6Q0_9BASI|nr:hypothetical protein [Austropuccinia psidii MF-1]